jgi:hypothetical protein
LPSTLADVVNADGAARGHPVVLVEHHLGRQSPDVTGDRRDRDSLEHRDRGIARQHDDRARIAPLVNVVLPACGMRV